MTCARCRDLEAEVQRLRAMIEDDGKPQPITEDVRAVFDAWTQQCKHPRAKLTQDRRSKVRARLREGYTRDDLIKAVSGAARGAYVDGTGHRWDDLSLICRDGTHVERFMALAGPDANDVNRKFLG